MPTGYCTTDDVRRALRQADLPGDAAQDVQIVTDAIAAQTEWFEKTYKRHWYDPDAGSNLLPTEPKTRDDEHDLPTHGGFVHGASEWDTYRSRRNSDALLEAGPRHERRRLDWRDRKQEIRLAFGDSAALEPPVDDTVPAYTRITFDRRDVQALNALHVVNDQGGFDDWVGSNDYSGGVGNQYRGEDFWVRVNNGGVSELYLDVHAMDDEIPSFANAVYVDIDFGHKGIPKTARRGIAFRAGADLVEGATIEIPQNANIYNAETKAEEMRSKAEELLGVYEVDL